MSEKSGEEALKFLVDLGVKVCLDSMVVKYDGQYVHLANGEQIEAGKLIWCAGVKPVFPPGLPEESVDPRSGRIRVERNCSVVGLDDIYAIGDVGLMQEDAFPKGHPQVAQVAIQQAKYLAKAWKKDCA